MKGVSLLETIVVIAIIATLSIVGVNNINNFKNDAGIDNATNELISDIRLARSKSMNGELIGNEVVEDFDPTGLPEYGLVIISSGYQLVRKCLKADATTCDVETPIDSVNLGPEYIIFPDMSFYFERVTGNIENKTITITSQNGKYARQIFISADSLITVTKI